MIDRKKLVLSIVALSFTVVFTTAESIAQGVIFRNFADGEKQGFIAGLGLGYGSDNFMLTYYDNGRIMDVDSRYIESLDGWSTRTQWKLGYAFTDTFAFYFASPIAEFEPVCGILKFSRNTPKLFYNGFIGYESAGVEIDFLQDRRASLSRWDIGGGFGFEIKPHLLLDFNVGYRIFVIPERIDYYIGPGDDVYLDKISAVFSLSYLFY